MQLLYGFLVIGGSSIYTFKVIPFFDKINAFSVVEYVFIVINVTFFWICSTKDPGAITAAHHAEYMKDYEPDGVYYSTAQECYTCKLVKPARSKHCCKLIADCEKFEPRSHFKSRLSLIVLVNVVPNRTVVVDSD